MLLASSTDDTDCKVVSMACTHLESLRQIEPATAGCEDCLATGGQWVHLRLCMDCGHVACCDSSPNRHATAHRAASDHPVVQSFEPGEDWAFCYDDDDTVPAVAPELQRSY